MALEAPIQILDYSNGENTAKVQINGGVPRGLGMYPEQCSVRICEPERANLPANLYGKEYSLIFGTDAATITVKGWRIADIVEVSHGNTVGNVTERDLEWDLILEDARWKLGGDRGGALFQGVLNPIDTQGEIVASQRLENSELVALCIAALPMTYREGTLPMAVADAMDAVEPMAEIIWRGADAATELQRLLDWTRCAFALNQDATYSIVKLLDPGNNPVGPDIVGVAPLPSSVHSISPESPGKCIITSAPTRTLIQRQRVLDPLSFRPMEFVGIEADGTIDRLVNLSWWPPGKTPIEVFRNNFADVAADNRRLAQQSVFRMCRLYYLDLEEDWTFTDRIVEDPTVTVGPERGVPLSFRVQAKGIAQNVNGDWYNIDSLRIVEDVQFDMSRGIIRFREPMVRLSQVTKTPEAHAVEMTDDHIVFTFAHYPNEGDTSDYFNAVYEWNGAAVVEDTAPTALADALAEGVPVYRFPDLQLLAIEDSPDLTYTLQNETEIKALALGYAKSMITAPDARFQVREYPGMHDVDPTGSITRVLWSPDEAFVTTVQMGHHQKITADYLQRLFANQAARGGSAGSPRGGGAGIGLARSASVPVGSGSLGPSSGERVRSSIASGLTASTPERHIRSFFAEITLSASGGANRWVYDFEEIVKTSTGLGASKWTHPTNKITGQAGNLFEVINVGTPGTAYLGIGITVDELSDTGGSPACPVELRPVPVGVIVFMHAVEVLQASGVVVIEYWFTWANGVYEESA